MANGFSGRNRHHRYAPLILSASEAADMIRLAESRTDVREAIETYTGKSWAELSDGDKVNALTEADRMARAAGAMAAGMRAWRDLRDETLQARPTIPKEDVEAMLREEIAELREANQALRDDLAELRRTRPTEDNGGVL